jgi:hypothetical protein
VLCELDRLQQRDELRRAASGCGVGPKAAADQDAADPGLEIVDHRLEVGELLPGQRTRLAGGREEVRVELHAEPFERVARHCRWNGRLRFRASGSHAHETETTQSQNHDS